MSVFEVIMLFCFGAAWPFSIYKSLTTKSTSGKSAIFLIIIIFGYIAGILNKIFYDYDLVIYLYIINLVMVVIDLLIFVRNNRIHQEYLGRN